MIGEDGGLAKETGAERYARRVELREVQLDDIVAGDQFRRDPAEGRREHALADADGDGDADDPHAVHRLLARQRLVVLRGHHGHFVAALGKGTREPLGIDREARCVRAIVSENGQDFHKAGGLYPFGYDTTHGTFLNLITFR